MAQERPKRRWNDGNYPARITVRLTREEKAEILVRADRAVLSDSRYLVRCGLAKRLPPMRDTPPPTEGERKDLEFLLFELRKVGTNLNQLAKRTNAARLLGRTPPPLARVEQAAVMVEGLLRLIRKRL